MRRAPFGEKQEFTLSPSGPGGPSLPEVPCRKMRGTKKKTASEQRNGKCFVFKIEEIPVVQEVAVPNNI